MRFGCKINPARHVDKDGTLGTARRPSPPDDALQTLRFLWWNESGEILFRNLTC